MFFEKYVVSSFHSKMTEKGCQPLSVSRKEAWRLFPPKENNNSLERALGFLIDRIIKLRLEISYCQN